MCRTEYHHTCSVQHFHIAEVRRQRLASAHFQRGDSLKHRLYIIEGLPCSGKSTTSKFVADLLSEKGKVCYVDEGSGAHPSDYEFSAFVANDRLAEFTAEELAAIAEHSEKAEGGSIVPLAQFSGELFNKLLRYKIYDFLPWEREMPLMLAKWRSFAENADRDTVYVFNCVLLQNPMCETMMRFGFSEEESRRYISRIAEIIRPLSPVVIYLSNDDIAECVKKAAAEREGWLDGVIDYHINGAYGKSIGASGFDGYIECLAERQRRELSILKGLAVDSLVTENPHRSWSTAYDTIRKHIEKL